jgi:sugar-specific transcriptional regulator TrmB
MDTLTPKLSELGLSNKSAELYIALLQLGAGTIQDLAKKTKIVRTTCYPLVEELERLGLVSTTKSGKRTLYVAESPDILLRRAEQSVTRARALIPSLAHLLEGNSRRPVIEIHEGIEGVWKVYEDIIKGNNYEVKSFVPADDAIRVAGDKKVREYIRKRVAKGISMRAIMLKTPLIEREYARYNKQELRNARIVNAGTFPTTVEITLYPENNVAITSFSDGVGLVIRSKSIYTALNSIFELAWIGAETRTNKKNKKKRYI